ncbi:MAG: amidohydrolase family protein [Firmicutes bacterium]|nr:amidohydrolase family protein [Bacillota bacterium]
MTNASFADAEGAYAKNERTLVYGTEGKGIVFFGRPDELPSELLCTEEEDMGGLTVMPALVDTHVHLRDPGQTQKESMETGMRAALRGGTTTVCAMANTSPVLETPELVLANLEKAGELNLCTLVQAAAAGIGLNDEVPTDRRALSQVTNVISNDGKTIFSDEFMEQLMKDSTEYGFVISTHCQPERATVKRDIELLEKVGGNLHVGHISRKGTLDMIAEAKGRGLPITCEVTPHHIFASDMDYRVNPSIRTEEDRLALIEGIRAGIIDCLCTDHAPHTVEDKEKGMAGISGIEFAFAIDWKVFHDNDIPLTMLSRMGSLNTARRLGFSDRGLLRPGMRADLMVVDTEKKRILRKDEMISRSHNTPFDGREILGEVMKTIVNGETLYDNGYFTR